MTGIIEGAGYFIYPLALCSLLAFVIIIERLIALRTSVIIPPDLVDAFVRGDVLERRIHEGTVGGKLVAFYKDNQPDAEGLKAFARLQVNEMERGLFVLEIVIAAAEFSRSPERVQDWFQACCWFCCCAPGPRQWSSTCRP